MVLSGDGSLAIQPSGIVGCSQTLQRQWESITTGSESGPSCTRPSRWLPMGVFGIGRGKTVPINHCSPLQESRKKSKTSSRLSVRVFTLLFGELRLRILTLDSQAQAAIGS